MNFVESILKLADPEIRLDRFSSQEKLTEFQNVVQLWAEDWHEKLRADSSEPLEIPHYDGSDPVRKFVHWNGLTIGITHPKGSMRYGSPMKCHYGHIRRSYPDAPDGKAFDIYVGDRPEDSRLWKINQLTDNGEIEEPKYLLFEDIEQAKNAFLWHVPRRRFGGIMPADLGELAFYRNDGCGCKDVSAELRAGLEILSPEALDYIWSSPPHSDLTTAFIQSILEEAYPDPITELQNLNFQPLEKIITGEFISPNGLYGFKLQKNYIGYGFKTPLSFDSTVRIDAADDDKEPIDYVVEDATESANPLIARWINQMDKWMSKQDSLEKVGESLYSLYDQLETEAIANQLYNYRLTANLLGKLDVLEEGEIE